MKTRDRILVTTLALFNEEGEADTTTIDIANELNISPGNLYYHFKGKDQIIEELFQQYELSLGSTLLAPIEKPLSADQDDVEANWYFLYVVIEEMYQYRFLYHNLDNLLQRYPDIKRRFKRLLQLKRTALFVICHSLLEQSFIISHEEQLAGLVDNMALSLNFWLNYDQLLHGERPPQITIHQGVLQLMTMMAPYLGDEALAFYSDCQSIYASMLEQVESSE